MIKVYQRVRLLVTIISVVTLSALVGVPDHQAQASTCAEILTRALNTLKSSCRQLGRDEACYGNALVVADLRDALHFTQRGDQVPVQAIRSLTTSPFNEAREEWGLSLLKLKTNLPDTLPGQNVTVLVYGDTKLENDSGNMQAFYFSTGLGAPECKEMPASGVLVRAPKRTTVTFRANGVDVRIGSTALLTANPNDQLTFTLIEGSAILTSDGMAQTVKPMEMVTVPLGGATGLEAIGVPSLPTPVTLDPALQPVIRALDALEVAPAARPTAGAGSAPTTTPQPASGGAPAPAAPQPTPTRLFGG